MIRKYQNRTLQTNPRQHEEELQATNSQTIKVKQSTLSIFFYCNFIRYKAVVLLFIDAPFVFFLSDPCFVVQSL